MKNILKPLLPIIASIITIAAIAQPGTGPRGPEHRQEKIESYKISFITQKLDLTPEEAQKFWPVYNNFQKELDALQAERKKQWKDNKEDFASLSDQQIDNVLNEQLEYEQKELDIKKKYHQQFKKVLPVRKVALLYQSEREFRRLLLEKLKEHRRGRD